MPRKIKTSIYLDGAELRALKGISKRTMIPMASLLRKAVKKVIVEHQRKS